MPEPEVVQAQYEYLESIATRFGQWAESNAEMSTQVRRSVENLMNGGWEGRGADAFFNEMGSEMLPAIDRFTIVLEQSQQTTRQIIAIFQQAEREAAALFGSSQTYSPAEAQYPRTEGYDRSAGSLEGAADLSAPPDVKNRDTGGQRNSATAASGPASNPRRRWGQEHVVSVNGVDIAVYGDRVTPRHLQIVKDTLSVIPQEHLELIPRIRVQEQIWGRDGRIIREGGGSGTVGNPIIPLEQQRINLTYGSLENESDKLQPVRGDTRRANITLLHEIGHVVDKRLGIVPGARGSAGTAYEVWFKQKYPRYRGATNFPGEWAAEAYSSYIRTGRPEIVGSSPAFRSVTNWR